MIGIDIEEVKRIERLLTLKPQVLKRLFTSYEWEYALKKNTAQTLTGFWCAKEAIVKALHLYNQDVFISHICLSHHQNGTPFVYEIKHMDIRNYHLQLSISHTKQYATAVCYVSIL
jgi:holo-[acyl-carrier protein] synthase